MPALLALLLVAAPPAPAPGAPGDRGPSLSETAKLYFLAGDVRKALEWCTRGLKTEPKTCKPMIKALAEYGYLADKRDAFTPEQARAFLEWDRAISPTVPSKLTEPTIERFVAEPLRRARIIDQAGDRAAARQLVEQVLVVDPKHAGALALAKELAGLDGGALDGGTAKGGTDGAVGHAQARPQRLDGGR